MLFSDEQDIRVIKGSLEDLTERILEHYNQAADDERSSFSGRVVTPPPQQPGRKFRRGRRVKSVDSRAAPNLVPSDASSEPPQGLPPPRRDIRAFVPSKTLLLNMQKSGGTPAAQQPALSPVFLNTLLKLLCCSDGNTCGYNLNVCLLLLGINSGVRLCSSFSKEC